jgi:hypothetical protein
MAIANAVLLVGEMPTQFPVPPTSFRSIRQDSGRIAQDSVQAFRACHERYNDCLEYQSLTTRSSASEAADTYLLDFDLVSKRAIGADANRYRLFQLHFLQGVSAAEICAELQMERFTLARELNEIKKLAGHAFTQRGLFPLNSYFGEQNSPARQKRAA